MKAKIFILGITLFTSVAGFCQSQNNGQSTDVNIADNAISVYPNPTFGLVTVSNVAENTPVQVFNILGEQVAASETHKIDLTNLKSGNYFIAVGAQIFRVIKK